MDVLGWRTALPVIGVGGGGYQTPVVVGLVNVGTRSEIAVRWGVQGAAVLLRPKAAAQLVVNLCADAEKRQVHGSVPCGQTVSVGTGLVDTEDGRRVALWLGEGGAVTLDEDTQRQLVANLRQVIREWLRFGGGLG